MEGHLHAKSFGGTCNWPHMRGARLIEVAATAGGTVIRYITNNLLFVLTPRLISENSLNILVCNFDCLMTDTAVKIMYAEEQFATNIKIK